MSDENLVDRDPDGTVDDDFDPDAEGVEPPVEYADEPFINQVIPGDDLMEDDNIRKGAPDGSTPS